jgi:hypothetical protein
MSHAQAEIQNTASARPSIKDQPYYAVPVILAILMLSSGGFTLLLAQSIKVFSSVNY